MAGVHSRVWILAISAALTSRAWSKTSSSDQAGYSRANRSAMALCSSDEEGVHQAQPEPPVAADAGQVDAMFVEGQQAVGVEFEFAFVAAAQSFEHVQAAAVDLRGVPPGRRRVLVRLAALSGRGLFGRVGSVRVLRMRMGRSGQSSSVSSGTCQGSSDSLRPWLSQSWTSNWSQAAASRFRLVAGLKVSRVSSSLLMVLGLGVRTLLGGFRSRVSEGYVAAEAGAGGAHARLAEVVVRAVGGTRDQIAAGRCPGARPHARWAERWCRRGCPGATEYAPAAGPGRRVAGAACPNRTFRSAH